LLVIVGKPIDQLLPGISELLRGHVKSFFQDASGTVVVRLFQLARNYSSTPRTDAFGKYLFADVGLSSAEWV
jgi:hypothetical protein